MRHEWAVSAEDVLFRRTKLGIAFEAGQIQALQAFMDRAAKTMDNQNIETAAN
jgi:glycerol-3-phosphate dehydrogenase